MLAISVMTYNIHSCIGTDGRLTPERIAAVIVRERPDIVAMQEVDTGLSRSGGADQARCIADLVRMDYHFHPSLQLGEGGYGNAVLSRFPLRIVRAGELPALPGLERRGALWIEAELQRRRLQVVNTHLGLDRKERVLQAAALVGGGWLGSADCTPPVVFCGDLNSIPRFSAHRIIGKYLKDVRGSAAAPRRKTWPSRWPALSLDHIFVSPGLLVKSVRVPWTPLTRSASDHLPLVAELLLM